MNLDLFPEAPEPIWIISFCKLDPNDRQGVQREHRFEQRARHRDGLCRRRAARFSQLDMVVADQNLAFLNVFYDEVTDASAMSHSVFGMPRVE